MKQKKVEITPEEYEKECSRIIEMLKGVPIEHTLQALLDFKRSVNVVSPEIKPKHRKGK